jgi:hypothetical protein
MANKRLGFKTSTNFTGTFSIFDALYEMESFNHLPPLIDQSTEISAVSQDVFSQDQFRDALLTKLLQVEDIE